MEPARRLDAIPGNAPLPTLGRSELAELLGTYKLSISGFCRLVGVHRSTLDNWYHGRGRPRPQVRARVVDALLELSIHPRHLFPHGSDPLPDVTDLNAERAARGMPVPPNEPQEEPVPEITPREYLEIEELQHFGLDVDPFDDPEDPESVWLPSHLQRIELALLHGVRRRQIIAVHAPAGAGKSTLLRRFYGMSGRQKRVRLIAPASLDRKRITSAALAVAILRDLTGRKASSMAAEPRSELLRTTLADQDAAGVWPVLLIDEAHLLKTDAFLAIKQIWDSHTLFRQLAVFMVGQEPLERRLRTDPALREVTGRTRLIEIPAIKDAGDYLRWRFSMVSSDADKVFDRGAYKALAATAQYPLWINNKAVAAMRYACSVGDERVGAEHVGRA